MNFLSYIELLQALLPTVQTIVAAIHPNDVSEQQKIATGGAVLNAIAGVVANPPAPQVAQPTPVAVPQSIPVAH